jgi:hypothetical protein
MISDTVNLYLTYNDKLLIMLSRSRRAQIQNLNLYLTYNDKLLIMLSRSRRAQIQNLNI